MNGFRDGDSAYKGRFIAIKFDIELKRVVCCWVVVAIAFSEARAILLSCNALMHLSSAHQGGQPESIWIINGRG
jgi:hypothetical protein